MEATEEAGPGSINVLSRYGSPVSDSYAPDGILIGQVKMHNAMPSNLEDVKVALIESALDLPPMAKGTNLQFSSAQEAEAFRERQRALLQGMAEHIAGLGVNVVLSMKDIHPVLAETFARQNIIACRRCSASNGPWLTLRVLSLWLNWKTLADGSCEGIDGRNGGQRLLPSEENNKNAACHSAPAQQASEEIARAMDDAIGVVHVLARKVTFWPAVERLRSGSIRLRDYATSVGSLESSRRPSQMHSKSSPSRLLRTAANSNPRTLRERRLTLRVEDGWPQPI